MKTLKQDEINTMSREEYAEFALTKHNEEHKDDFISGFLDLDTFRFLYDNHQSMVELENGDIIIANKGGKRKGAGRKPAHPLLKKEMISLKLPRWIINKLDEEEKSRAVTIEIALCEKHGWTKPDVGSLS